MSQERSQKSDHEWPHPNSQSRHLSKFVDTITKLPDKTPTDKEKEEKTPTNPSIIIYDSDNSDYEGSIEHKDDSNVFTF